MKTIDIIRKGTPEGSGYCDSVAVIEDGNVLFENGISCEPNPYQPTTSKLWYAVYARIAEGTYGWQFIKNHEKYGKCILLNGGSAVPTLNPNANQDGRYIATQIFIHRGYSPTWRGSRGCLTVPLLKADEFFNLFEENEIGKLVIRKNNTIV
jgi:hypothetical protein